MHNRIRGLIEIDCAVCGAACHPKMTGLRTMEVPAGILVLVNNREDEKWTGWLCEEHQHHADKETIRFLSGDAALKD